MLNMLRHLWGITTAAQCGGGVDGEGGSVTYKLFQRTDFLLPINFQPPAVLFLITCFRHFIKRRLLLLYFCPGVFQ
jgi:hypothetical protein